MADVTKHRKAAIQRALEGDGRASAAEHREGFDASAKVLLGRGYKI